MLAFISYGMEILTLLTFNKLFLCFNIAVLEFWASYVDSALSFWGIAL